MSKLQRTPPAGKRDPISSENDNPNSDSENLLKKRKKRPRSEEKKTSGRATLKDELLSMLNNWKEEQNKTLSKLCSDIADVKKQNASIQKTNADMEKALDFMSKQYEDMKDKLLNMEREKNEHLNYIAALECKMDDMEKKLKFTVVEFRNMPSNQQAKHETPLELCELVEKTCNVLNVLIQPSEIKDIYRIKNKSGASTVITEFTTVLTKNKVLYAAKEFNRNNSSNKLSTTSIGLPGAALPVYVAESLTKKDRILFAMARERSKTLEYKYCWTNKGRIYMRKTDGSLRVEIRTDADLIALKKE